MYRTLTIAKRELSSLFYSPIAYVVFGLFVGVSLWMFSVAFAPGQQAWLRPVFVVMVWCLIFLAPALSMRLITDEFRTGTIETLMTAPLNDAQVIVGKWLGAVGFLAFIVLVPIAVMVVMLRLYSEPDYGPILSGLMGVMLVGGLYLAIGTFASATTQNQIIAFLLTVLIICIISVLMQAIPLYTYIPPRVQSVMSYIDVNKQFEAFSKGLIDTSNFIYFFSGIAMFLFFAVKLLESKRWR